MNAFLYLQNEIPRHCVPRNDIMLVNVIPTEVEGPRLSLGRTFFAFSRAPLQDIAYVKNLSSFHVLR